MNAAKYLVVGLLAIAPIAITATTASAQSGRDAAVQRCAKEAQTRVPGVGDAGDSQFDRNRTAAYKACMERAGFTP